MTDRELLEAAAKAAGYVHHVSPIDPQQHRPQHWTGWNPLTDDGDALRLAVKLRLMDEVSVMDAQYESEDPLAATRLAIVRAAAAISKEMK
jgi:hypothetical protein